STALRCGPGICAVVRRSPVRAAASSRRRSAAAQESPGRSRPALTGGPEGCPRALWAPRAGGEAVSGRGLFDGKGTIERVTISPCLVRMTILCKALDPNIGGIEGLGRKGELDPFGLEPLEDRQI